MSLKYSTKLYSAPIAGFTDENLIYYFFLGGADYIYSEMFNVNEINRFGNEIISKFKKKKFKLIVQLFGKYGDDFINAASLFQNIADGIDINAGCSVKKIIKSKGGAYLLLQPENLYKILKSISDKICIPVSVKMRLGFDKIQIFDIIDSIIDSGVSFITIHLRTASMLFSGEVNYEYIDLIHEKYKDIANKKNIKFIFNGDVNSVEKALYIINKYNPYGLMIGRAALTDPFIFYRIKYHLNKENKIENKNDNIDKKNPIFWFKNIYYQNIAILIGLYLSIEKYPENEKKVKILGLRKLAHKLLKNFPNSKIIKEFINKEIELKKIIDYLMKVKFNLEVKNKI